MRSRHASGYVAVVDRERHWQIMMAFARVVDDGSVHVEAAAFIVQVVIEL